MKLLPGLLLLPVASDSCLVAIGKQHPTVQQRHPPLHPCPISEGDATKSCGCVINSGHDCTVQHRPTMDTYKSFLSNNMKIRSPLGIALLLLSLPLLNAVIRHGECRENQQICHSCLVCLNVADRLCSLQSKSSCTPIQRLDKKYILEQSNTVSFPGELISET